jgi:hypothetical protein
MTNVSKGVSFQMTPLRATGRQAGRWVYSFNCLGVFRGQDYLSVLELAPGALSRGYFEFAVPVVPGRI